MSAVTLAIRDAAENLMEHLGDSITIRDAHCRSKTVTAIVTAEEIMTTTTRAGRKRKVVRWIKIITDTLSSQFSGFESKEISDSWKVIIDDILYAITDTNQIRFNQAGFTDIQITRIGLVDSTSDT